MAKQPESPSYAPLNLPAYQPINASSQYKKLLPLLSQYADVNIEKQVKAQDALTRGSFGLTEELTPRAAQLRVDTNAKYAPKITEQYLDLINQADPEFLKVRNKLGARVSEGLDAGYGLGDELSREIEQSIRKGQTARGNWLGPAPTAAEAFGKGEAALNLYNQRLGQGMSFLSSRAPSDLFASYGITEGFQPVNAITPTGNYVDAGLPANLAVAEANNQNSYNNSLIGAYAANTSAQYGSYDRQWDRYLYGQAVSNGLYNPVTAGGGGGWGTALGGAATGALTGAASGAMIGSVVPGIGTAVGAIGGGLLGAFGGGMMGMS